MKTLLFGGLDGGGGLISGNVLWLIFLSVSLTLCATGISHASFLHPHPTLSCCPCSVSGNSRINKSKQDLKAQRLITNVDLIHG